ncbi:Speedy protein E4 [Saguinus oedipus]|uniref:Speedy protein E4 n=1 Tax=Saguinus oedipus TaxID=9490 RepID=A0ABQ9W7L8_SAGOE|nr:Speedy protein E4 [Saguinus oedipus]
MEEDNQGPKQAIFYFLYGKNRSQRRLFQKLRFQFFCSMHCRAWVSPEELEENTGPREMWIFSTKFIPMLMTDRHQEGGEEPFVQII